MSCFEQGHYSRVVVVLTNSKFICLYATKSLRQFLECLCRIYKVIILSLYNYASESWFNNVIAGFPGRYCRLLQSCSIIIIWNIIWDQKVYLYSSSPFFRASMTGPNASMDLLEKEL